MMNDTEMDALIRESLQRDEQLKTVEENVMKSLQTEQRHVRLRRWTILVGYCLGLPLLLVTMLYSAIYVARLCQNIAVTASMVFFVVVVLVAFVGKVNFSPRGL